jgi:hypothetical protein
MEARCAGDPRLLLQRGGQARQKRAQLCVRLCRSSAVGEAARGATAPARAACEERLQL